jgi:hypothetical protein
LIYFNDSVLVAAIRGAPLIEIASVDPEKGIIFYTVEQSGPTPVPVRQDGACLICHDSLNSQGIPGLLLRSVPASGDGSLCIIEAMKLMNEIECECDGEIAAAYVDNGQPVQFGDRLFAVKVS